MSFFSTIISISFLAGIYGIIPEDYYRAAAFCSAGIIIPYISIKLLSIFKFNKMADLSCWLMLYLGLCMYSYTTSYMEILLFSLGACLNIFMQFITGGKVVLFYPFKEQKYRTVLTPFISLALFLISALFLCLVYINVLTLKITLLLGILLYILTALNMDFFKRLSDVIHYTFKIDIEDLKKTHRENTIKVLLKEISPLWTRNKAVISLQSLANGTWLANEPKKEIVEWEFSNDEIRYFWDNELIKPRYREDFKNAAGEILNFLDNYGNCPSVVKEQSKSYGKYGYADEKTTFDILYNQKLINHTLSICRLILKDIKTFQGINLEKMLLTALGHDIGKAASFSNIDGYKTGDHPNTSIMLIETRFNYFEKLTYADEVMKMIKNHHAAPSASTPLLQEFKEYDSKARREYLKEYFKHKDVKETEKQPIEDVSSKPIISNSDRTEKFSNKTENNNIPVSNQPASSVNSNTVEQVENNTGFIPSFAVSTNDTVNYNNALNNSTDDNIIDTNKDLANQHNTINTDTDKPLKRISSNNDTLYADLSNADIPDSYIISSFFDINEFLKNISKSINIIDKTKFNYFTVNGDMVLCYTAAVIFEVKKAARLKKVSDITNLKENEIGMSFTEYCRKLGILHTDWIQEGYYQGNFALTDIDGNIIRTGRYIPLRIDAFAEYGSYAEFEERKKGVLENIVNAKVAAKEEMFQNLSN